MSKYNQFKREGKINYNKQYKSKLFKNLTLKWIKEANKFKYSYNFEWLGRPIIQYPQDIIAIQQILFKTKPEIIIETGIAHGGSIIFSASMLELLNIENKKNRKVIGVDIDIREHNLKKIQKHYLFKNIKLFEGSSTDIKIFKKIKNFVKQKKTLVILDSNHTHDHVLNEMKLYSKLVSKNSYLIVLDTILELITKNKPTDRPWHKRNNPMTAIKEFLKSNKNFKIDKDIDKRLLISCAPGGYLKKI